MHQEVNGNYSAIALWNKVCVCQHMPERKWKSNRTMKDDALIPWYCNIWRVRVYVNISYINTNIPVMSCMKMSQLSVWLLWVYFIFRAPITLSSKNCQEATFGNTRPATCHHTWVCALSRPDPPQPAAWCSFLVYFIPLTAGKMCCIWICSFSQKDWLPIQVCFFSLEC